MCLKRFVEKCSKGNYAAFLEALGARESGGDYRAVNNFGFLGKYQMGRAALVDAGCCDGQGRWIGRDGVLSLEDFLSSPKAQEKACRRFKKRQWRQIRALGLHLFAGSTIAGIDLTASGLLAGAHLVGPGGLKRFLDSGGADDAVDGYGTRVSEYLRRFSGYATPFENQSPEEK